MDMGIKGRKALVCGASAGLGFACAQALAHEGVELVIAARTAEVMGPQWPADKPFPILVKWLDCKERLSLQVHPPAAVAPELNGEPKTENWFIAACTPGAHLIVGLKRGVTCGQFAQALTSLALDDCVHRFPVNPGDSILVPSGQIHAIDGGNLILEIQQNSDTTYRIYDWGRVGLDGKPRTMHVGQSLKAINWDDFEPAPVRGVRAPATIADAPEFRIRRVPLATGAELTFVAGEQPRILSVIEGNIVTTDGQVISAGENVIIPYSVKNSFIAQGGALALVTENFC